MKINLYTIKDLFFILRLSSYISVGAHEIGMIVEDNRK